MDDGEGVMGQDQPAGGAAATCTGCGAALAAGTTATGTAQCATCVWGPDLDWSAEDDAIPPQCTGCGAAIIPGVTALPWGAPRRRDRCQDCAVIGQCTGCGEAIVAGYNDVAGEAYRDRQCMDCAPDLVREDDVLVVLADAVVPGDAYDSRDTIL